MTDDPRQRELAENLRAVHARIDEACRAAGRDSSEVTLIVVTKTYPAADVARLAALGVTEVGENRDQEAAAKVAEVGPVGLRWHFIGQLQRNKCRSVVRYADVVQSVDSVRLAGALGEAARRHRDRPIDVLVQVSLDGDPSRGGAVDGGGDVEVSLERVLAAVAGADGLRLSGLMAVAPFDAEPARAFADLAGIAARVRLEYPDAGVLSAGMSGDVEQAIQHGATHVRLGSAVLGNRTGLM